MKAMATAFLVAFETLIKLITLGALLKVLTTL